MRNVFSAALLAGSLSSSIVTIMCVGCVRATFSALCCWQQCGQQHNYQNVCICCVRATFSALRCRQQCEQQHIFQNVYLLCARTRFQRCVAGSSVGSSILPECVYLRICCARTRVQRCVAGRQLEQQHNYHNVYLLCAHTFSALCCRQQCEQQQRLSLTLQEHTCVDICERACMFVCVH